MEEILKEVRQLKKQVYGEGGAFAPGFFRIPTSLRPGAEPGEFCYEGGKLKVVAPDGSVKTFSPDA
jgi:hypothetical protein